MDDIFLQTQDAYELHTQAQASLAASRTPLRDYLRSRGSRMMAAIRGLGGCAPRPSRGYDVPVMDPSRASHRRSASSRQQQSARPSASYRQPDVGSQAAHDTVPGTQSSPPQETTVPMSAPPVPDMSTVPVFEQQHHTPGATSAHDNAAVDRTPTWSGTSGFIWDPLPHAAFGDLLTYQFSQYPSEAGPSNWQQEIDSSSQPDPVGTVLQSSTLPAGDASAWYTQTRWAGGEYTFGTGQSEQIDDAPIDQPTRQGPSQAAGRRETRPRVIYTPEDFRRRGHQ